MVANRNALKAYAPQARTDFIRAMTDRAALFGVTKEGFTPGEERGDLFLIGGKAFPKVVAAQRMRLLARIECTSFDQVMEAVAYTWFNRFLAIRYMELHGYFDHGYRVLSHPRGEREPEILQQAQHLSLPGLDPNVVVELKLAGDKDETLYRRILIAQCNDLHKAMPFLFERIDDETELLLPENLLQSDSIIRKLVNNIAEPEWDEVEIIGWLYQFYISEKKDLVIGKVVKSEDIPAATQLFTPNWIVKYMVQNSLGAQWLATYPDSGIRAGMEYYIAPAEQTPEVLAQIDAITPKQLDPEAITLIDPAVGSGHILVEAYDLFSSIYLERGYTKREAARAILTKNLFGLDIDDRAAQMAGFALLMKACADDRTVLRNPPKLNVLALQDSEGLDAHALAIALLPQERFELVPSGDLLPETLAQPILAAKRPTSAEARAIKALVTLFDGAKTFGSLINVPDAVMQSLPLLDALLAKSLTGDLLLRQAQEDAQKTLKPLVEQAWLLGDRYDCVVANPPYMGGNGMNGIVKAFAGKWYPDSKSDLLAMFVERGLSLSRNAGRVAMVTIHSWMFLASFTSLRKKLINNYFVQSLVHIGYNSFPELNSKVVQAVSFVICKIDPTSMGVYVNCNNVPQSSDKQSVLEDRLRYNDVILKNQTEFNSIPGSPFAYSASSATIAAFLGGALSDEFISDGSLKTGDNEKYIRFHWEVCGESRSPMGPWRNHPKGGEFRKWSGNREAVVRWTNDSISHYRRDFIARILGDKYWDELGISWSAVSSGFPSFRILAEDDIANNAALCIFPEEGVSVLASIAYLNSVAARHFISCKTQTLNFLVGDVLSIPKLPKDFEVQDEDIRTCIKLSDEDWDSFETSWDFAKPPLLSGAHFGSTLAGSYDATASAWQSNTMKLQSLEERNNNAFIRAYNLEAELSENVPLSQITLTRNPHYRYGGDLTDQDREARLKSDTMRELVSYAIGCMMGRYSLAEPGLVYAHSGGVGFDPSRYGSFPADDDGIIPLTEEKNFPDDDAAERIEEFLDVAWPEAPIMETMTTLMDGLYMENAGEPRAALRSYLSKQFYKDHLQTYKNRPIYWLFSSGKQKAFEALVYLHRYNEGTLARMRTVYVTPLMGKLQQRADDLDAEIAVSASSAEKTRKTREKDKLLKQVAELRTFDEELRHLADQRIKLDLDDGVKVNYGRFGNLLAAKEKVCGKADKED